jgi:DNA-binding transcriptional regulator GbsR (MarR family)
MLQIATKTFNNEFSNLNEEEKKEFKFFTSLDKTELFEEINKYKTSVSNKLSNNLNESNDEELKEKIQKTLNKINETDSTLTSLYKLKQLEKGL